MMAVICEDIVSSAQDTYGVNRGQKMMRRLGLYSLPFQPFTWCGWKRRFTRVDHPCFLFPNRIFSSARCMSCVEAVLVSHQRPRGVHRRSCRDNWLHRPSLHQGQLRGPAFICITLSTFTRSTLPLSPLPLSPSPSPLRLVLQGYSRSCLVEVLSVV